MSTEQEIASIERNIKEAKRTKELGSALEKLRSNKDFKAVIGETYFKDEAVRLVHLRADPAYQTPERQAAILRDMDSIGALAMFFVKLGQQADMAQKEIDTGEAILQESRDVEAE